MSKPEPSLTAVIGSGGKQYRVAPGDRILVDRLDAEPGSTLNIGRVLLVEQDGQVRVGTPVVEGVEVEATVVDHRRGPRVESIRYKSKKRVRVHHGGRADLTEIAVVSITGMAPAKEGSATGHKSTGARSRRHAAEEEDAEGTASKKRPARKEGKT